VKAEARDMVAILTDRAMVVAIITTITRGLPLWQRHGLWQWSWKGKGCGHHHHHHQRAPARVEARAMAMVVARHPHHQHQKSCGHHHHHHHRAPARAEARAMAMVVARARAADIITTITIGLPLGLRQGLWPWSWLGIITTITRRAVAIITTLTRGSG
jgi:hypothetical protein